MDINKDRKIKYLIVFFLTGVAFILLTIAVYLGWTEVIDATILHRVDGLRSPGLTTMVEGITYLGNWEAIVIVCLLLVVYEKTRGRYGIYICAIAIGTTILKGIVKPLMGRERPSMVIHLIEQGGYSFPSGHAITSIGVFGVLALLFWRSADRSLRRSILLFSLIFLSLGIGVSRVYLGVHYPSDVLAGWLAGVSVSAGVLFGIDELREKRKGIQVK